MLVACLLITTAGAIDLPPDSERVQERARLVPSVVTQDDVRELFVPSGDNRPALPSPGMLTDLVALADHPDPTVRRALPEALYPWYASWTTGVLPEGHGPVIDEAVIVKLARDPDKAVRKRTTRLIKEARPGLLSDELGHSLLELSRDPVKGVRRISMAALSEAPRQGILTPAAAWMRAMDGASEPAPVGRTACVTLAKLQRDVKRGELIDPRMAVARCMLFHPEKAWIVWNAWRDEVPFDRDWADMLVNDTIGFNSSLAHHWVLDEPDQLAEVFTHSQLEPERLQMFQNALSDIGHERVRASLGLPPPEPKPPKQKFKMPKVQLPKKKGKAKPR